MFRLGKGFFLLSMACSLSAHGAENMSFAEWYEEFRREAVDNGVSA